MCGGKCYVRMFIFRKSDKTDKKQNEYMSSLAFKLEMNDTELKLTFTINEPQTLKKDVQVAKS